jgi:hypothetical protein
MLMPSPVSAMILRVGPFEEVRVADLPRTAIHDPSKSFIHLNNVSLHISNGVAGGSMREDIAELPVLSHQIQQSVDVFSPPSTGSIFE